MAGEWPRTSLRDAGVTLIDCDHRTPPAADSGFPYIAIPQLKEGRIDLAGARRISAEHFAEWTKKAKPQHHDVILSRRCNPGETAHVPDRLDCALGQNLVLLRSDGSRLFPPFLRWVVRGPDWWEQVGKFINVGAVFESLKCAEIPHFKVPLPPLAEQKAIAAVLGALDDKIELNRRMNATLESMARALFQSWFVDFEPVRAKINGGEPEGMDAETAALFPEHLVDSPLGRIPKGWRACTLGEIAKNVSITFDFKRTSEVVFINTGDVLEGDFLHSKRSPHGGLPGQAKKSIRTDDILFSEIRPANKRYAYVDFDSSNYVVSTKFMIIRGSKEIHPRLLYRILTAKETLDEFQVQAESRSGTFPQITFDSISHLPIVLPPIEIQESYQRAVENMDAQIKVNKQQSCTLATLRDTLLPKLLSGELGVAQSSSISGTI
jgi:type I restriction enzyme S subunit